MLNSIQSSEKDVSNFLTYSSKRSRCITEHQNQTYRRPLNLTQRSVVQERSICISTTVFP